MECQLPSLTLINPNKTTSTERKCCHGGSHHGRSSPIKLSTYYKPESFRLPRPTPRSTCVGAATALQDPGHGHHAHFLYKNRVVSASISNI
jgi:hypothetical protein